MSDRDDTRSDAYTRRLETLADAGWKRFFDVQAPYRWNIRRLDLGFTLDVGCGIGRNLLHLGGHGVGIDHNADSIEVAKQRGCTALTSDTFDDSEHARADHFDSLLLSHVVEHTLSSEASDLGTHYLCCCPLPGNCCPISPSP